MIPQIRLSKTWQTHVYNGGKISHSLNINFIAQNDIETVNFTDHLLQYHITKRTYTRHIQISIHF